MSLTARTRMGPYEIVAPLGAGGMGEVYRARDSRLARDVAIKVLPRELSADPERLGRFEQEARAASALNHPNILTVFDIGAADGAPYVVTELLEGETLAESIQAVLPLRKAIEYATQIAKGLAAAHGRGIVHRDLKPDNVFVTTDGRIKILDFGLAKIVDAPLMMSGVTAMPTAIPRTMPGVVLGTAGYMSPEQVRGQGTDHRSDIFAFGAILYEMLAGRRAFRGDTAIETLSAILREEPAELTATGRVVPPALERIVTHCLEKRPEQRFQSASDIAFALEALSGSSDAAAGAEAGLPLPRRVKARSIPGSWLIATTAVLVSLALAPFAIVHWREAPESLQPVRFSFELPADTSFTTTGIPALGVSPDGTYLAFAASSAGTARLWLRRLDEDDARPVSGTEGATNMFWSPDSRSIAFVAASRLKKVSVEGGAPQTIGELPARFVAGSGSWSPAGVILLGSANREVNGVILRFPASGGAFTPATERPANENVSHVAPLFLPDGRRFLFSKNGVDGTTSGLFLGSIDSSDARRVSDDFGRVQFNNGFLLFPREGAIVARPFNLQRAEFAGEAVTIADGVLFNASNRAAAYAASDRALVFSTGAEQTTELTWFSRSGLPDGTVGAPGVHQTIAVARDMSRVVYGRRGELGVQSLWVTDLTRNVTTRLTFGAERASDGIWSPDLTRIVHSSIRGGVKSLYEIPSTGGAQKEILKGSEGPVASDAWSPDGRFFLYHFDGGQEIRALPMTAGDKPFVVVRTSSARVDEPAFSSDGRWLSYGSEESGRWEVYVMPFPPTGARWQASSNGGGQPRWRGDGRELFYLAPDGTMMAVDVKTGLAAVELGTPHPLFKTNIAASFNIDQYAVSTDGQRFLIMNPVRGARTTRLNVILNWQALLKVKS